MNLDDINTYIEFDRDNIRGSIELLPKQIQQTWSEVNAISLPPAFDKNIDAIVFSGMGGSGLGGFIAKQLYGSKLPIPFEVVNDYYIPQYVTKNTLVVVQSYSGTTEESLSAFDKAHAKGTKLFAIASGKDLLERAIKYNVPYFKINPLHNPSNQPRMAIGYSIFAIITLLSKLHIISLSQNDITRLCTLLNEGNEQYGIGTNEDENEAKTFARLLLNKLPLFFAGEHLLGAVCATRNQYNENAKSMAIYFPLPEADHHVLEALQFPVDLRTKMQGIFYSSKLLSDKIKVRTEKTAEILEENGVKTETVALAGSTKLEEVLSGVQFGAYLGFYVAMLHGINPTPVPWIESFKKKIA